MYFFPPFHSVNYTHELSLTFRIALEIRKSNRFINDRESIFVLLSISLRGNLIIEALSKNCQTILKPTCDKTSKLTFDLLFRSLDVSHHPWHIYTISVQVFQEHICISPSQCASLERARQMHHPQRIKTMQTSLF